MIEKAQDFELMLHIYGVELRKICAYMCILMM